MDLPLFPLHLVLFPGRPLPLHLFEPRYLQMLKDCMDDGGQFGVVAIRSGRDVGMEWRAGDVDPDGEHVQSLIHEVGTVAQIRTISARDDGRFDIITRGRSRFRVLEPLDDRPYLHARVEVLDDTPAEGRELEAIAVQLREVLVPYLTGLGVPEEYTDRLPTDAQALAYMACASLQVEVPVQQRLLELPTCAERMIAAIRIIRREAGIIRHLGLVGSFRPAGPGGAQLN